MFKISLPNPSEHSPEDFFAQMKIVIKSAQIAYEQITKDLTKEEKNNYWMHYSFPQLNLFSRVKDKDNFVKVNIEEEGEEMQNIELEIEE